MNEFQSQVTSAKTNLTLVLRYFDHSDRSSLSGKFGNHDTVITLFQVKPEKPPKKPDKTQIDFNKVTTKGKLPSQEK